MKKVVLQKNKRFVTPDVGRTPAVALVNPKFSHNVSSALRSCAAFGAKQLWISGSRAIDGWEERGRLPREERMRAYGDVEVCLAEYFYDAFPSDVVPVAIEVMENAEPLTTFQHPEKALYVFGPEDGGLGKVHKMHCQRFVIIPSDHCLNLATAVTLVLAHRRMQRQLEYKEPIRPSSEMMLEDRGFIDDDSPLDWKEGQ